MRKTYEQDYINKQSSGLLLDGEDAADDKPRDMQQTYIRPRPFPHDRNRECALDVVCHENECRILQKLVCQECAYFVHPNHKIDSLDWYIGHIKEKIKRRNGVQKTTTNELGVLISDQRKKRIKYLKYIIKTLKKVEKECRSIEDFTDQKVKAKLSSNSRREAFEKMIRLLKQVNHPKLDQLKQHHQEFFVKYENDPMSALNDEPERKEVQRQISEIVDQLFMADERERYKIQHSTNQVQPQDEIKTLRQIGGQWERNMNKLAGAIKRFSKRMLQQSRMSIRASLALQSITLVDVDLTLIEDREKDQPPPKILQILPLNKDHLITVHPNEIRLWKYDSTTFQEFKPIAPLPFDDLKHVCVADLRDEFVVLFGTSSILSISCKSLNTTKNFQCPIQDMKLYRILMSGCQNLLIASGGCNQNAFNLLIWQYNDAKIRRVIKYSHSFPNDGDMLISYTNQHLFRCNKNTIEVFGLIEGVKKQTLQVQNIRDQIEQATILTKFQEQDSLCISTNRGFYVYTYDESVVENNYKLVYNCTQTSHCIFHVFYQYGLAEEGFLLAALENNETKVIFQDLNSKPLLQGIQFSDQVLCGKLDYQRNPWINQLVLLLGFESGMLRVVKFTKK